jgi:hypothetical protein
MALSTTKEKKDFFNKIKRHAIRIAFLGFLLSPLISFLIWYFLPKSPIRLIILDKTVLNTQANEHRSFNWILRNEKFFKPDGDPYVVEEDYLGFFPLSDYNYVVEDFERFNKKEIDSLAELADMTYFTDTYGIYKLEWYQEDYDKIDYSELIYGGMSLNDLYFLEKMLEKDKLVITEFNIIANPTRFYVRRKTEEAIGMRWSGWVGRYFNKLDTLKNDEMPLWAPRLYRKQYQKPWTFKNPGMIFVHESEKIVVLEDPYCFNFPVPVINVRRDVQDFYGIQEYHRYPYWFDIVQVRDSNNILASYSVHTNEKGDSALKYWNIPKKFPSFIGDYKKNRFFYFAGDYSDNPVPFRFSTFYGIHHLSFLFYDNRDLTTRLRFFFNFYQPVVKKILKDYYNTTEKRRKKKKSSQTIDS